MTRLHPVPQPPDPPDGEAPIRPNVCRDCKRKDKMIATLEAENARLLRAVQRETDAHLDQRTDKSARDYVFRRR